jgi:mRNA-degrading endonuclease RelE of RelBE toxin-antitoxin system
MFEEDLDDFYGDHQVTDIFEEASLEAELPKSSVRFAQQITRAKDGPYSARDANGFSKPQKKPADSKKRVQISTYRIFCTIECHGADDYGRQIHHPTVIFEDVPQWNPKFKKTNPHLIGRRPIFHLSTYLSTRNPLSFVIFRNYSCTGTNYRESVSPPKGVRVMPVARMQDDEKKEIIKESLEIKSETLEAAIKKVARCKMNCFIDGLLRDSPGDAYLEYGQDKLSFDSPYLFLYHHRLMLSELSKKEEERTRREILSLLIYLKERENALYKESDQLLAKGKTNAKLIKFLFCPNEMVVTRQSGIVIAYAIKELYVNPAGSVRLKCWAWIYGGGALRRQGKDLQVHCKGDQTIAITDLPTYPLRFASQEIKDQLIKKGERFWELRVPQLVTYRGMNFLQERYIVSHKAEFETLKIALTKHQVRTKVHA